MTQKDLKDNYELYKRDGEFRLHHLTKGGRSVHKYLCSAVGKGTKFNVIGYEPTSKIEVFKAQVEDYLSKLEYDSDYFNPDLREGVKHIWFVHDYLTNLGFRMGGYKEPDAYIYDPKNIFGGNTTKIIISFSGLESGFMVKENLEEVTIILSGMGWSWTTVTVKRNFKDLQTGIDSLLAPLLTTEAGTNLKTAEKCKIGDVDFIQKSLTGLDVNSINYKSELKNKLLEMAEQL